MATIKSFTDINQAKALSKILPLESADMVWEYQKDRFVGEPEYLNNPQFGHVIDKRDIACWSLSALLGVLPYPSLHKTFSGWRCDSYNKEGTSCIFGESADNPIDACVAMIEKLNELKML